MTREELLDLEGKDIAAALNEVAAQGKNKQECMDEFGLSAEDIRIANVFWVKDKWMARAWGGYTSTKRSGNELGDTAQGVGGSYPSKGFAGV